ncbi:CotO family spore coat protein [Lederbergia graminis]|uniref:CotO family spore coat protein n=1 Tax=Lederbergia graminis TaxID=735518 RepID=A0ABW0LDX1_9BACI
MEDQSIQKKGEPLLYIHQPNFPKPVIKMQDTFITSRDIQREVEGINLNTHNQDTHTLDGNEVVNNENSVKEEVVQKKAADYFREQSIEQGKDVKVPDLKERKTWKLSPVKSFRSMSIPEKLQYLSRFPKSQPPYACEFITESNRARGFLDSFGEGKVGIRNSQGEIVELQVNEIKGIRIIL